MMMRQTTLYQQEHERPGSLPKLKQRSHEEMLFVALVLQILRDHSMPSLAACLKSGDDLGQVDAYFQQLGVAGGVGRCLLPQRI